jgi:CHAD domain-containing protein
MAVPTETRKFAAEQTCKLLRRLAFQVNRGVKSHDADAIHDLRVSIRRFSQALVVFKPSFRGKEMRKIRQRLKRIMVPAGEVRNYDIALKLVSKSPLKDPSELRSKLQGRRKESERALISLLKRWTERKSSQKWRVEMEAALARAEQTEGATAVEQIASETLCGMAKDFFERGSAAANPKAAPAELHRFRIAAKKFRYSLELLAPLYGATLERWLERIKGVQALLGDINDYETVRQMLAPYKAGAEVTAWLKKRERKSMGEFRQYWNAEFGERERARSCVEYLRHPAAKRRPLKKPMARVAAASAVALDDPQAVA